MRMTNSEHETVFVNPQHQSRRIKIITIPALIFIAVLIAGISIWAIQRHRLRTDMENNLSNAISYIQHGRYRLAITEAQEARSLSERLRDDASSDKIDLHIRLVETVIRGNELFNAGKYQQANNAYLLALDYSSDVDELAFDKITGLIVITQGHIHFFELIERADSLVESEDYKTALSKYEEAGRAAEALSFVDGEKLAKAGIADTKERIIIEKRILAQSLLVQGNTSFDGGYYSESILFFQYALEIFGELDDLQGINLANIKISHAERAIEEKTLQDAQAAKEKQVEQASQEIEIAQDAEGSDTATDSEAMQNDFDSNYDYNRSLNFDLSTIIDTQNKAPANLIKMGYTEGLNEGWYNGCGWVAAYNALILLGNPLHPAEIVKSYEESGGTVLGGLFGTYPHTIEKLFKDLGYDVNHTIFPLLSTDIDEEIKSSKVSILAYAHKKAAHFATVKYRQQDGKFIVYNDSYAKNRSIALGFEKDSDAGAAIDSVEDFIKETKDILFSFSIITIS